MTTGQLIAFLIGDFVAGCILYFIGYFRGYDYGWVSHKDGKPRDPWWEPMDDQT